MIIDIGEPYRGIFEKIIDGIEDRAGTPIAKYPVQYDTDIGALKSSLYRQNTKVVIALGRQGMKTAAALDRNIWFVVGGVLTVPESEARMQPVISLSPDPALLFARLKVLMPTAKRVFVVYDPGSNDWLMKLQRSRSCWGLELVTHEAHDLRSAVRLYQEIFSVADSRRMRYGYRIPSRWMKDQYYLWCYRHHGTKALRFFPVIPATSGVACYFRFTPTTWH